MQHVCAIDFAALLFLTYFSPIYSQVKSGRFKGLKMDSLLSRAKVDDPFKTGRFPAKVDGHNDRVICTKADGLLSQSGQS